MRCQKSLKLVEISIIIFAFFIFMRCEKGSCFMETYGVCLDMRYYVKSIKWIHFFWLSVLHPSEYIIKINESNDIDAFAYTQKMMPLQIVIVHWMVDQINLLSVDVMKKDLEIDPIHILVSSGAHTTKMCILYTKYVISKRKYMWVTSHY